MSSHRVYDFKMYKESRVRLMDVAMGKEPADLVLKGGNIVCVDTREVFQADVAVKGDRIALVGDASHSIGPNTQVVDVQGKWISRA